MHITAPAAGEGVFETRRSMSKDGSRGKALEYQTFGSEDAVRSYLKAEVPLETADDAFKLAYSLADRISRRAGDAILAHGELSSSSAQKVLGG